MNPSAAVINARFAAQTLTGVQRYAWEVMNRLKAETNVSPQRPHEILADRTGLDLIWEQTVLPYKARRARVLWSPTGSGPLFCPLPHVVTLHDGAVLSHPKWFSPSYARWRRFFIPQLVRSADLIITVSEFAKSHLSEHLEIDAERIVPIYNGCDAERFGKIDPAEVKRVRQKYDLPSRFVFGLASLEPRKNFPRFLRAWEQIENEFEDVGLVIGGGKGKHFRNTESTSKSDRVSFLGYVPEDDLPALYAAATVFVYPSIFEGFGLPVLEAMAARTPVITSDAASLPEVAGDAALLVDPYASREIAEAIMTVLGDRSVRLEMVEKGVTRAGRFSWDKTARKTLDVLNRV